MRHQARVLQDAIAGSTATVALEGVSACQRCARGEGCGAGLFNQQGQPVHVDCQTPLTVLAEQSVIIEHEDGDASWLWAVAGAYGLPTLGLLLACLLATLLLPIEPASETRFGGAAPRDWLIGVSSLAGLAGGLIAWRKLAPLILARIRTGPCLQSARIVAVDQSSLTPSRESRNEA